MFKVNNEDFIVNIKHILHLCSSASIVNFEHVITGWVIIVTSVVDLID